MSEIIAAMIELVIFLCALWFLSFLSTLLHELGHALGYMLATGDGHWHIRVGWGKRLLNTKALTVNLLVFDGFFTPSEKKIDTKAKLITTLSGGPAASLLLFLGLLVLRFGGFSFQSDILADGVIESFLNIALFLNLFILLLSVVPVHYFHGEVKGLETDGLQIIHAMKKDRD
ncbi:MAG: hypothetical protein IIY61_05445 [Ruminococcus sp.]|nr:hypothetical protein [Ruminococcus sp.]